MMYCQAGSGNFVAGIAAETVHAAPAPDQQRVGDDVPKFDVVLFEFDQIFPDGAPRAGAGEFAVGIFQKKFRMIFLQRRTPAGVVDDDVNEDARAERMRGVGEFAKLVNAGGAFVEFDQRRDQSAVKSSAAYGLPKRPKRA